VDHAIQEETHQECLQDHQVAIEPTHQHHQDLQLQVAMVEVDLGTHMHLHQTMAEAEEVETHRDQDMGRHMDDHLARRISP